MCAGGGCVRAQGVQGCVRPLARGSPHGVCVQGRPLPWVCRGGGRGPVCVQCATSVCIRVYISVYIRAACVWLRVQGAGALRATCEDGCPPQSARLCSPGAFPGVSVCRVGCVPPVSHPACVYMCVGARYARCLPEEVFWTDIWVSCKEACALARCQVWGTRVCCVCHVCACVHSAGMPAGCTRAACPRRASCSRWC